jgi:ABC-type sugar transport system substrate-binding protein
MVALAYGGYTNAGGRQQAQDLLVAHPDLKVIASFGDNMSVGIYAAIKGAGKAGAVKITSVGGTVEAINAIKAGQWYASTIALPQNEVTLAMNAVVGAARGKKNSAGISELAGIRGVVPSILSQANEADWRNFQGQWNAGN